jgi:Zn2+/Cd2+-exporting ATPase
MKRYTVRNLSCPSCAQRIETELNKLQTVREARIDFAQARLDIETSNLGEALAAMRRIEPGISLLDTDDRGAELAATRLLAAELAAALLLFAAGWALPGWWPLHAAAYAVAGWRVLVAAARNLVRGALFDEHFLMTIATAGAVALGDLSEAALVMIFYQLGALLESLALDRSRRSIRSLLALQPDEATLVEGEGTRRVLSRDVAPADIVLVLAGERIPVDGTVLDGTSTVDTSALTGEAVPRDVEPGSEVFSGTINRGGMLRITATRRADESSVARVMHLVEEASGRKARTERFLTTFARAYTPAVVAAAALVAFLPPLLVPGQAFGVWVHRALVILVISCPCALVVSVPLAYFGGIGAAARRGILFRGSQYIDALANARAVVFDKTGTLTDGSFAVTGVKTHDGRQEREVVALAAAAAARSTHPVARSVHEYGRAALGASAVALLQVGRHEERGGHGISADVDGRAVLLGNDRLLHSEGVAHPASACVDAGTRVHLAVDGRYAGALSVGDRLKPGAAEAVRALHARGVTTAMLTGDTPSAAAAVAAELGIDDVHAGLLPQDKLARLEEIMERGPGVVFVGDGVNDAPVLARADVGIAIGETGSDAAVDTADVVLVNGSPACVDEAFAIARWTRRLVWENIVFALAVKLVLIGLGAMGLVSMWGAVFGDVGVTLLAILNSLRVLRR